jgi:predicted nucleotidyltransferase
VAEYEYADEAELLRVLDVALAALAAAEVPFLVVGGIASAIHGRPRWTRDIDLFFKLEDAGRALDAFAASGFETEVVHEHWLAKARLGEITVDVLTRSTPDVLLDDEMLERSIWADFKGRAIRLLPPEDLVVMKAAAASEDTPRYWYDAIGIVARSDLDWDYLLARARAGGARRVLAVLLYAQSNDVAIPIEPLRELADLILGRPQFVGTGGTDG